MRIIVAIATATLCLASLAQGAAPKVRLSKQQHETVQRCAYAASTAAEAFRQFPTDKNRRLQFVANIAKRFERGSKNMPPGTAPSTYQMILALVSMESDQSLDLKISVQHDSDLLVARASGKCALTSDG